MDGWMDERIYLYIYRWIDGWIDFGHHSRHDQQTQKGGGWGG